MTYLLSSSRREPEVKSQFSKKNSNFFNVSIQNTFSPEILHEVMSSPSSSAKVLQQVVQRFQSDQSTRVQHRRGTAPSFGWPIEHEHATLAR